MYLYSWLGPVFTTLLIAAVLALLLLGTPGMVILPWRTTTYGSDPPSVVAFGSGARPPLCTHAFCCGAILPLAHALPEASLFDGATQGSA